MTQWLGCSFIGLGIGASSDASKPYQDPFQKSHLAELKQGTETELLLIDGEKIEGNYAGLDTTGIGKRTLVFHAANDTTRVPLNEITQISVKRKARLRGFLIGALLDFMAFITFQKVWETGHAYN
ncbi:hypothetical protein GWO43_03075 [candidate division KSB1 bacterium]|nr:hypothetical protein [candidate division KSB1 bacterium]NIR70032.1 hypothetical protein [candidate division KSB1 bacterium]NIT69887.1 hypothetical protein [candidate division KSB1 bacterium]NIU89547.1 hypothetical protein [candidate division KSB1 bacterium]NIV96803.1 hypothetical protein [candidate division KSB1 bacterium]